MRNTERTATRGKAWCYLMTGKTLRWEQKQRKCMVETTEQHTGDDAVSVYYTNN